MPQPPNIRKIYEKAGVLDRMPEGRGMNTPAFHKCAASILKDNPGMPYREAAIRCMGRLGRDAAVNKEHWDSKYKGPKKG